MSLRKQRPQPCYTTAANEKKVQEDLQKEYEEQEWRMSLENNEFSLDMFGFDVHQMGPSAYEDD